LLRKNGNEFWKCWKSKFETKSPTCKQVEGITAHQQIVDKFQQHFAQLCSAAADTDARDLHEAYVNMRPSYISSPHMEKYVIDAELVEKVVGGLKRDKAA